MCRRRDSFAWFVDESKKPVTMHLLTVSLFVLGLTGSLWTTLYAIMLHEYERCEFLVHTCFFLGKRMFVLWTR